jgi:hypothetical protein
MKKKKEPVNGGRTQRTWASLRDSVLCESGGSESKGGGGTAFGGVEVLVKLDVGASSGLAWRSYVPDASQ